MITLKVESLALLYRSETAFSLESLSSFSVFLYSPLMYETKVLSLFSAPAALLNVILWCGTIRQVRASTRVDFPEPTSPVKRELLPLGIIFQILLWNVPQLSNSTE